MNGSEILAGENAIGSADNARFRTVVDGFQRFEEVVDGRNAHGNRPPRGIGSSASKLMTRIDGSHYDVKISPEEATIIRLWLDSGAVANGTYAIMDGGTPESPRTCMGVEGPALATLFPVSSMSTRAFPKCTPVTKLSPTFNIPS